MLVKIDNMLFDTAIEPIMIILSSEEKDLIRDMGNQTKFCVVPQHYEQEEIEAFMNKKVKKPNWIDVPPMVINYIIPGILFLILLTFIFH
jgi:hypothetical protein